MGKRNRRLLFLLSEDEYNDVLEKAERCGLSMGAFVRSAVFGQKVYEAPSAGVPVLIREVRRVGSALEQLLLDGRYGEEETQELKKALEANRAAEKKIAETFVQGWR